MNSIRGVKRSVAALGLLAVLAAPAAHADGTIVPGATLGALLTKSGSGNVFIRYLGEQAWYTNDLYFFLSVGGSSEFILRNHDAASGAGFDVTTSSGLATGAELIFSICANLGPAAPGTGCTTNNQFFVGSSAGNPDGVIHAAVWTRADFLAGCAVVPSCDPAGVAALQADPTLTHVIGFEDSFNYNIDSDFNDVVFGVRGLTVVPEPVTMTLLATGLAGMGGAARIRRRRKQP